MCHMSPNIYKLNKYIKTLAYLLIIPDKSKTVDRPRGKFSEKQGKIQFAHQNYSNCYTYQAVFKS